jgi:hypothetical protein
MYMCITYDEWQSPGQADRSAKRKDAKRLYLKVGDSGNDAGHGCNTIFIESVEFPAFLVLGFKLLSFSIKEMIK